MYYVYVLKSIDEEESYYLGYSQNLVKRLASHNKGENTSTRNRQWQLVYYEAYLTEKFARHREAQLKKNRRMKQFLLKRVTESLK